MKNIISPEERKKMFDMQNLGEFIGRLIGVAIILALMLAGIIPC